MILYGGLGEDLYKVIDKNVTQNELKDCLGINNEEFVEKVNKD